MRIRRDETAAVVIDYQTRLLPVMDRKEELLKRSSVLLAGLRTLGIPMVLTQQYTKGLGMTDEVITGAAGTEDFVEKIRFGAWKDVTEQHPWIRDKKFVILCGIEAHICVLQTLIDLAEEGYVPVLVADCISSRRRSDYETALLRARQEGAVITTSEGLLFELLQEAGTAESKIIQKLIK